MAQTKIRDNITYRKLEKKDNPVLLEFIEKNYSYGWECESAGTKRALKKLYLYDYMRMQKIAVAAVYRGNVIGVIVTGNRYKKKMMPIVTLKRGLVLLRLKITKEGRANIKNLKQKIKMEKAMMQESGVICDHEILILHVRDKFDRKFVETKLLDQAVKVGAGRENTGLQIFAEQKGNLSVYEEYGFKKMAEKEEMMEVNRQRFREKRVLLQYEKVETDEDGKIPWMGVMRE